MPRGKTFVEEKVLDEVVRIFWANGFEGATFELFERKTGIKRQSLYDTYGNKHQLFLKALERYQQTVIKKNFEILKTHTSAKVAIRNFFESQIKDMLTAGKLRGCLVTNSVAERALVDRTAGTRLTQILRKMEQAFADVIRRGQAQSEFSTKLDVDSLASFLVNSFQGLLIMGKARTDREKLRAIVRHSLAVLG